MVIMHKLTPEKKEKWTKKIDKMLLFLEEFRHCLKESEEYDDEDWDDEPHYRDERHEEKYAMRGRYSRR